MDEMQITAAEAGSGDAAKAQPGAATGQADGNRETAAGANAGADAGNAGAGKAGGGDAPLTAADIEAALRGKGEAGKDGAGDSGQADISAGQGNEDAGKPDEGSEKGTKEAGKADEGAEKGKEGEPEALKEWKDLASHLPKEADIDPAIVDEFARFAQGMKLEPEQARQLIDWQLQAVQKAQARVLAKGFEELCGEWGRDTQANLAKALGVAAMIDRKLGNEEFSRACGRYGVACDKAFVKGMHVLATMLAEDSLGAAHGQGATVKTETPYEALKDMFK